MTPAHAPSPFLPAAVAIVALAALGLQVWVATDIPRPGGMAVWWWLAGYFTILTNLGVALILGAAALGRPPSARLAGGLLLAILIVGIVYHLVLARLWSPQGWAWWADQGLHTAVPLLTLLWWVRQGNKQVGLPDLPAWLAWPAAYAAYALVRGAVSGFWPYPFLDADLLGWPLVARNVMGLVVAFAILGLALLALARRLVR